MREVTLVVLAGGEGLRMGRAKGGLRVRGRPILEYLVEGLGWEGATLLVTAPGREGPVGAGLFDREVVDREPGMGALGGILTGLEAMETEWGVVCVVDMPGVGREQVEWVVGRRAGAGVMVTRGGRVEPFPCVLRKSLVEEVRGRWERGERAVKDLARAEGMTVVEAPGQWGAGVWANLNYPGDLEAFERGGCE